MEIGSGVRIQVPLRSWKALRDENLVVQRFDYSCGSAALATLMRYGYGHEVGERDILNAVFETLSGDEAALRKDEGLSLLDLQRVAEARGFRAQGFKLLPENLPKLKGPVIVFISPRGYDHFAVLRGVRGSRVYLADPSRGNLRLPAYRFLDDWLGDDGKGIIFVIEPEGGSDFDFALKPLGEGLTQPELLTARQMLKVGNPFVRLPELVP
ncbi:MAG: C39 family peptidase [Proteobacteria bacterium]|nr:C39 family peptidase [Pseudomonadota bacterium]